MSQIEMRQKVQKSSVNFDRWNADDSVILSYIFFTIIIYNEIKLTHILWLTFVSLWDKCSRRGDNQLALVVSICYESTLMDVRKQLIKYWKTMCLCEDILRTWKSFMVESRTFLPLFYDVVICQIGKSHRSRNVVWRLKVNAYFIALHMQHSTCRYDRIWMTCFQVLTCNTLINSTSMVTLTIFLKNRNWQSSLVLITTLFPPNTWMSWTRTNRELLFQLFLK